MKQYLQKIITFIISIVKAIRRFYRKLRCMRLRRLRRMRDADLERVVTPRYSSCKNCGTHLEGMYCSCCGQYAREIDPSIFEFIKQYFENAFQWDGRFFLTIRRLFLYPGYLSVEFVSGHIRRYVFPLKMYMFVAVLFGFLVLTIPNEFGKALEKTKMSSNDSLVVQTLKQNPAIDSAVISRVSEKLMLTSKDEQFLVLSVGNFLTRFPLAMMFTMPIFALLTMLFYRRRYRKYLPHVIFSIHLHTIIFITFIFMLALRLVDAHRDIYLVLVGWVVFYGYIASVRFFRDGYIRVFFKNMLLFFLYFLIAVFISLFIYVVSMYYDAWITGSDTILSRININ